MLRDSFPPSETNFLRNSGRILENVVFVELMHRTRDCNLFFEKENHEIDFVVTLDALEEVSEKLHMAFPRLRRRNPARERPNSRPQQRYLDSPTIPPLFRLRFK
ncbi:MAG: hypothetical protein ACI4P3_00635 [Candidatus Spyradosoma sp.]